MKKIRLGAILVAAVLLTATPAWAFSWYIGGGLDFVSLGGDLDSIDSGSGLVFNSGFKFSPNFSLDLTLGVSGHDWEGEDVSYARFGVGPKFQFPAGSFTPYLTLGLMSHVVEVDAWVTDGMTAVKPYTIDGAGLYLGAGFDLFIDAHNSVGVSLLNATWDGEDDFGYDVDGKTGILRVVYLYNFL